jgi:16S rRNA (guanine1207-N2)-methyltransferase
MIIQETVYGVDLELETDPSVFSPKAVDAGTKHLLSMASFKPDDKVLDLGCGYGVVGIVAAKLVRSPSQVFLLDKDPRSVELARANAGRNLIVGTTIELSDGFRDFGEAGFTVILCNPRYHVDFSVPKHFIEKGFNRLLLGGRLLMVTQRRGWYRNKLRAIFGNVSTHDCGDYSVFESIKSSASYANRKRS